MFPPAESQKNSPQNSVEAIPAESQKESNLKFCGGSYVPSRRISKEFTPKFCGGDSRRISKRIQPKILWRQFPPNLKKNPPQNVDYPCHSPPQVQTLLQMNITQLLLFVFHHPPQMKMTMMILMLRSHQNFFLMRSHQTLSPHSPWMMMMQTF